ncbi:hypothetical protein O6P43_032779 [Quillaja saponaria]|uniref:Uncharacterized protein n=1 Tax=Quillaja saponaria TaxID=32244 RepID=A0AAD7KQQ9_QUISA|nr:hypothetical protein O6P43_032779 [Quillaja saponaria]
MVKPTLHADDQFISFLVNEEIVDYDDVDSLKLDVNALDPESIKFIFVIEVVRLLAWNIEEIEYEIYRYAKEGKMVELVALLLVSLEKITSPSIFQKSRTCRVHINVPHFGSTLHMRLHH